MAKPSEKSPEIDEFIKRSLGIDRKGSITNNVCAFCGQPATEFRDKLSEKEYSISGMCQKCQDETFGG